MQIVIYILSLIFLHISIYSNSFSIASCNMYYKNTKKSEAIINVLKTNPDIIIFHEWTGDLIYMDQLLSKGYFGIVYHPDKGRNGIGIYSKLNINIQGKIIPPPYKHKQARPFASISFVYNEVPTSIIAVHPTPLIRVPTHVRDKSIMAIHKWFSNGMLKQNIGSALIGDQIILAGDFNTLPESKLIKKFYNLGFTEVFDDYPVLKKSTWSIFETKSKIFKIDYIFISSKIKVLKKDNFFIPGSDHNGVFTEVTVIK